MLRLLLRLLGIKKRQVSVQKLMIPLTLPGIPSREEVNSVVQNSHCTSTAQFIAIVELLAMKGILEDDDQDFLQKRKTYWLSQFDQMVAQRKDDALKEALDDFRRRSKG